MRASSSNRPGRPVWDSGFQIMLQVAVSPGLGSPVTRVDVVPCRVATIRVPLTPVDGLRRSGVGEGDD